MPVGVGVKDSNLKTDLLYNEFIVYDIAQVNKFLVDVIMIRLCKKWTLSKSNVLGERQVSLQDEVQLQNLSVMMNDEDVWENQS